MTTFEDSVAGGLVVNTTGGKYSGGACPDQSLLKSVGCVFQGVGETVLRLGMAAPVLKADGDIQDKRWWAGFALGLFIVCILLFAFLTLGGIDTGLGGIPIIGRFIGIQKSGFESWRRKDVNTEGPAWQRFAGSNSQVGLGVHSGFSQEDRDVEYATTLQSGFMNSRDQPYFSDVTNRVLRMENREKEAVRALGKINQERLRRAAEDTASTTPLPWGPFWKEWKQTHPLDGEDVESGFQSDFEDQLNKLPVY